MAKTAKKKVKKSKRQAWGAARIPLFEHIKLVAGSLGITKFNDEAIRKLIWEQARRDLASFHPKEQKLHSEYVRFGTLSPRAQKAFMTQFKGFWTVKKVIIKVAKVPPPPPPNAVSAKTPPPPPPNAVSARKTLVEQFAEDWDTVYEEDAPLQPLGTIYGDAEDPGGVRAHDNKVCISVKFRFPADQDEIIEAITGSIRASDPFSAEIMEARHFRTHAGFWVDLLIHYSCPVVDLYKHIKKCELVQEIHAKPAADFGVDCDAR